MKWTSLARGDRGRAENLVDGSHCRRVGRELAFEPQLLVHEGSAAAKLVEKHGDVVCRSNSQGDGVAARELKLGVRERRDLGEGDMQDAVDEAVRHGAEALQDIERNRANGFRLERERASSTNGIPSCFGARAGADRREAVSHRRSARGHGPRGPAG